MNIKCLFLRVVFEELDASRVLTKIWRVEYQKESNVSCPFMVQFCAPRSDSKGLAS